MSTIPEKPLLGDRTKSTILSPDGTVANYPTTVLHPEEAILLREYKKFLQRYGLKEALFCQECWNRNLNDGCEAYVTPDRIMIRCRCKVRYFTGQTL